MHILHNRIECILNEEQEIWNKPGICMPADEGNPKLSYPTISFVDSKPQAA
jgi:hypothetical protein